MTRLYRSRPGGPLGADAVNFFRNTRLRSLFASFFFRCRLNRALSPLSADMVTNAAPVAAAAVHRCAAH